jgi:hypothetical protein
MPEEDQGLFAFVEAWNGGQGLSTPRHHRLISAWLEDCWQDGRRHLLLMAFRSSGKSTLVGLFCAWLLKRDPNLRILVLAADLALAKKMVRTVKRILERHPGTQALKPEKLELWGAEQFTVSRPLELRDPSMLARGITANLTGSRADVVICDDVEVPRTCDTAPKRDDLRMRLSEVDYVIVPGGLQLYVGTPHTYYTIYAADPRPEIGEAEPFLAGFERMVLPVLDRRGESIWPERFTPAALDRIRRSTGVNKFRSQMMLEPVNIADGRLDPDRMVPYEGELSYSEAGGQAVLTIGGRRMVSASCWWDPAYGARAPDGPAGMSGQGGGRGDASVVAAVFSDADGGYWLHRLRYLRIDPADPEDEATQQCRQVVEMVGELHLPAVTVEANGLGAFLPGILRRELGRAGIAAAVIEARSTRAKADRIVEAFDVVLAARALHAHRSVWDTPFVREMREWRPDGRGRTPDDGLDAVSGCLTAEPVRVGRVARPARRADWRGGGGVSVDSDFIP